ncbi:MAG: DegT/DnrJ/EryC1/StrS family aminotransferase [Candidatus Sumerlaeaceae bacterium]
MIAFQNVRASHESFLKEYFRDLQKIFQSESPDFIGNSKSKTLGEFEHAMAEYLGVKHALGLNSGTDALLLALDALGVGEGDEVIMPAFGFIATADVVVRLKAKPVFVDIQLETFNIDPTLIEGAITERTKAIIPVHLFGQAAAMTAIMEIAERHNLALIEDVAQACGAEIAGKKLGAIGTFGAFSFYPTKNLGGAGDGGLIATNDDELAYKIRLFRDHGRGERGFETIGYNSRLDPIQALYLRYKLEELDDSVLERVANARLYNQLFAETEVIVPGIPDGEDMRHTFNLYTIRIRDRERAQRFLNEKEISTAIYYDVVMPYTPALRFLGHREGEFPNSEEAARTVISLPVWPGLSRQQIKSVATAVTQFLENNIELGLRH